VLNWRRRWPEALHYKEEPEGYGPEIDRAAAHVLKHLRGKPHEILEFSPYGV